MVGIETGEEKKERGKGGKSDGLGVGRFGDSGDDDSGRCWGDGTV